MFKKLALIGYLILLAEPSLARGPITSNTNPEKIDFYLLTVGLGDTIAARYGHTIIKMVDQDRFRESNINWGMFNFADPYLPLNFFLGQLRYWVTDESSQHLFQRYRYYEKRPVVSEKINLTNKQKTQLFELIMDNLEPENRYFWYQYFYKNCSTIPRDYLDQVLQGAIMKRFESEFSDTKFREYVRVNLNRPPIIAFFLDIVMNDRLDAPLSKWIEMFYPPKLREHLLTMPAFDDSGNPIADSKLLTDTKVIVDLEDVPEDSWSLHPWFLGFNLLALILGFSLLHRNPHKGRRLTLNLGKGLVVFCLVFWSLFAGILGVTMASSWMFSAHLDLYHNANLFLLWPMDFLFLVPCRWVLSKKERPFNYIDQASYYLAIGHLILTPIWVLACTLGLITQNCNWVILYVAPVAVANCLFIIYKYRQEIRKNEG